MLRFKELSLNVLKQCRRSYSLFGCDTSSGPIVPNTKVCALSNGMRIATEESDSPIACVALFVEAGPIYETPDNHGITHFIEHMAYRGFKSMGKQQLEDFLVNIGAKMTAVTTREYQVFSGLCPVANATDIVNILSKIITELELSEPEMELAKCMIDTESMDIDRNPKALVSDYLHESAFQCTPLGRRMIGHSRNIKKFDKKGVEGYMKKHYYPGKLLLATSGQVNHGTMVNSVEKCFGNMNQIGDLTYGPPQRYTGSQIMYRDDSMDFVYAAIAVEAPGMRNPDYLSMLLASYVMGSWSKSQGGHDRHAPPLARAAATSDLCDIFESFYIPYRDVGLWGVYMVSKKMDIEDMIYNVQDRWMNLCTTTIANDVERGLNMVKLELAKKIEDSVKSCYDIGTQIIYNCERKSLPDLYNELSKIKQTNLKDVTSRFIYDKCPVVVAVGPTECIPDYTRIRAGMYWLRL